MRRVRALGVVLIGPAWACNGPAGAEGFDAAAKRLEGGAIVVDATIDSFASVAVEEAAPGLPADDGSSVPFDAGAGVVVVATDQQDPTFIAVDQYNLYWTALDLGRTCVVKMPLAGGAPVTLARGPGSPFGLAVDSANVYWTQATPGGTGSVMSVPIDGGPAVPLAMGQAQPVGPAVDSERVYWSSNVGQEGGLVMAASLDGAAASLVAAGQNFPNAIAVDATSVYWLSLDGILRAPLDGGAPMLLANAPGGFGAIAVDTHAVYSASACSIQRTPLDGGAPEAFSLPPACPGVSGGIATDGLRVYWATPLDPSTNLFAGSTGGTIASAPVDGDASTTATTIAAGQNHPSGVTVDATHVYWTNSGSSGGADAGFVSVSGQVMMAPK